MCILCTIWYFGCRVVPFYCKYKGWVAIFCSPKNYSQVYNWKEADGIEAALALILLTAFPLCLEITDFILWSKCNQLSYVSVNAGCFYPVFGIWTFTQTVCCSPNSRHFSSIRNVYTMTRDQHLSHWENTSYSMNKRVLIELDSHVQEYHSLS